MKTTEKIKTIRAKKIEELKSELSVKRQELALASLRVKAGKLPDISIISKLRKDIARINTIISEKTGVENE